MTSRTPAARFQSRRMRQHETWRALVRETHLSPEQLVLPLFVRPGRQVRAQIPSLPGHFQLSVDQLAKECAELHEHGVNAVLLFGLGQRKDERGRGAYARDGIVQEAVAAVKARVPLLRVITDVCLCAYTSHGHCGVVKTARPRAGMAKARKTVKTQAAGAPLQAGQDFWIDNEATLELLAKTAVSHAQAGADMVAPSDMMDGSVAAIRDALDASGHERIPIMAYAAKYASVLYAPFRMAVDSTPVFGDRRSYQMDPANSDEALRKVRQDIEGGADIIIVKPAGGYQDVIYRLKQAFGCPIAAFQVSGEYAMVKAAAARGWLPERPAWLEQLLGLKRAGADILITYWAREAVKTLSER